MPFQKGHKKIGGRKAETPNKVKKDLRTRISMFLEDNFEMTHWKHLRTEMELVTTIPSTSKDMLILAGLVNSPKIARKKVKNLLTTGEMKIRLSIPLSVALCSCAKKTIPQMSGFLYAKSN